MDSQIESRRHEVDRWESERRSSLNPTAENFWKDQPAKASVVAATSILANLFGGYAEGLTGGATRNPARGMLEQATERWIQDQKEKHDRLASNKKGAENAYTEALKRYGSPEEAELGMRIEAMAIEDAMLENNLKKAGLWERNADAGQLLAERQQQREMLKVELDKMARGRIVEQWRHIPASAQVVGGGAQKPREIDRMVRLPGGGRGWTLDAKTRREVQSSIANGEKLEAAANRMEALISDPRAKVPGTAEYGRATSEMAEIQMGIKNDLQLGAWDEGAAKITQKISSDPTSMFTAENRAKVQALRARARSKLQTDIRYNVYADPDAVQPLVGTRPRGARREQ